MPRAETSAEKNFKFLLSKSACARAYLAGRYNFFIVVGDVLGKKNQLKKMLRMSGKKVQVGLSSKIVRPGLMLRWA